MKQTKTDKPQKLHGVALPSSRHDHWCASTLRKRGWTQAAMDELLPRPRFVRNPHANRRGLIREYPKAKVLAGEKTAFFKEQLASLSEKRRKRIERRLRLEEIAERENLYLHEEDRATIREEARRFGEDVLAYLWCYGSQGASLAGELEAYGAGRSALRQLRRRFLREAKAMHPWIDPGEEF